MSQLTCSLISFLAGVIVTCLVLRWALTHDKEDFRSYE